MSFPRVLSSTIRADRVAEWRRWSTRRQICMNETTSSKPIRNQRVAIVGAGISGLTVGWYLRHLVPGIQVDLFERSSEIGGVIQTVRADPYLAELGADNFATLLPDALQLVQSLGIEDEFIAPNLDHRFAQVVCRGRMYPIPSGFSLMQPSRLIPLLASPVLSLSGKLRALGEYFVSARTGSDADESVESFAVRRLGRECFDRLIEPIVGGIFTARAETLSMQAAMPQFVKMEREHGGLIRAAFAKRSLSTGSELSARRASGARYDQFLAPRQGMSWFLNELARDLAPAIHFRRSIQRLEKTPHGTWRLYEADERGHDRPITQEYDAVCIALPSSRASELLKSSHRKIALQLERIPYASSAVAILALKREEMRVGSQCFGIVVPKCEHRNCLAISLSSEKYEGRSPKETVLVRVFMGGAVQPEILDRGDDELMVIARREVEQLLGPSSLPRWQRLVRWNQAMPQYMLGHVSLVQNIRQSLAEEPTLKLIGNAFDGVGIPQCVRLARQTAEQLAQQINEIERR